MTTPRMISVWLAGILLGGSAVAIANTNTDTAYDQVIITHYVGQRLNYRYTITTPTECTTDGTTLNCVWETP